MNVWPRSVGNIVVRTYRPHLRICWQIRTGQEHAPCCAINVTIPHAAGSMDEESLLWTLEKISRLVSHSGNPAPRPTTA